MHRSMALAIGLLAALPAFAQQTPNDISTLNKYAGTYAVDCSKPGTTRLTVGVKALALQSGTRRLQTAAPMAAFSYFGNSPPPNYDVALLGEAPPTGLAFIAMKDKTGLPHGRRRPAAGEAVRQGRAGRQVPPLS
jgi:hypothetical protein